MALTELIHLITPTNGTKTMESFNYTCQGASHIAENKVCQDSSLSINADGLCAAVVCDGHGGKRYFRSDKGAEFAAKITGEKIKEFVENFDKSLIADKQFTQCMAKSDPKNVQSDELFSVFNQLFTSIVSTWYDKIGKHANDNPLTDKECELCEPEWIADFKNGIKIEKSYGCTLMAAVFTETYWFAFHIGDGKMIALQSNPVFIEPVPWDDKCFLNKTTSLCDSNPLDEFRYCYCGDGNFPDAIFLGSDGMDDSFGATENLADFYIKVANSIVKEGKDQTFADIEVTLPNLSKKGSQDDMSLAVVFDTLKIADNLDIYKKWQLQKLETEIAEKQKRTEKYEAEKRKKISEYETVKNRAKQAEDVVAEKKQKFESAKQDFDTHEKQVNTIRERLTNLMNFFSSKKQVMLDAEKELQRAKEDLDKINSELKYSEKDCQIADNELQTEVADLHKLLKKKIELGN